MSDPALPAPNPARDVSEESRIPAKDLEKEIGDSEAWDEASHEPSAENE